MKSEEYYEWQTQMRNDVPRQNAIKVFMKRNYFSFLDFEHADDPKGQVANEQESHHRTARFRAHLLFIGHATTQSVKDEDGLKNDLQNHHPHRAQRQDADETVGGEVEHRGDEHKAGANERAEDGGDEQHWVEREHVTLPELESGHARETHNNANKRDNEQRDLGDVEDLDCGDRIK